MPRERKSLQEHALTGTQPDYVQADTFLLAGRPKYPRGLTPDAKKIFKQLCAMLERRKSLTPADGELIKLYALASVRFLRALAHVETEGEVVLISRLNNHGEEIRTPHENLWLDVLKSAEKTQLACLDRLGLTPLNRGKVPAAHVPKKPDPNEHVLSRENAQPDLPEISIDELAKIAEQVPNE